MPRTFWKRRFSCIIADGIFERLTNELGHELGIPVVHFCTVSACCFWDKLLYLSGAPTAHERQARYLSPSTSRGSLCGSRFWAYFSTLMLFEQNELPIKGRFYKFSVYSSFWDYIEEFFFLWKTNLNITLYKINEGGEDMDRKITKIPGMKNLIRCRYLRVCFEEAIMVRVLRNLWCSRPIKHFRPKPWSWTHLKI